jgi:hypothetical protein
MADSIKPGSILIESSARLPDSLQIENEPYSGGWKSVKNPDSAALDRAVREAGWTFFYLAGDVRANAFGAHVENTTRKAIQKILENLNPGKFNCLQIDKVASKRFLGLPYATVSAHWRHIQENMLLSRSQRLAERDRGKPTGAPVPISMVAPRVQERPAFVNTGH